MAAQHTYWPTEINIARLQSKQRKRASLVGQIPGKTVGGPVLLLGGARLGSWYIEFSPFLNRPQSQRNAQRT